ncbi:MAG: GDSL-type esterase/lipase family protein [Parvibaculaceae bacterium]
MSLPFYSGKAHMLRTLRASLVVLLLAGLTACSTPAPVPAAATIKGFDEPFFIQPERMEAKAKIAKSAAPVDLLFVGDSITQNYEKPEYQAIWARYFAPRHALNLGYGLDTSGATHWRIRQGELTGLNPRVTIVLLGTNDTNVNRSVDQSVRGIARVIDDLKAKLPQTKILLIGILPSARSPEKTAADHQINAINAALYAGDPRVTFLSLDHLFIKNGALNGSLYVEQPPERALHPNPQGQALMAEAIEPALKRLLGE